MYFILPREYSQRHSKETTNEVIQQACEGELNKLLDIDKPIQRLSSSKYWGYTVIPTDSRTLGLLYPIHGYSQLCIG